jgi:hypothetical protein
VRIVATGLSVCVRDEERIQPLSARFRLTLSFCVDPIFVINGGLTIFAFNERDDIPFKKGIIMPNSRNPKVTSETTAESG